MSVYNLEEIGSCAKFITDHVPHFTIGKVICENEGWCGESEFPNVGQTLHFAGDGVKVKVECVCCPSENTIRVYCIVPTLHVNIHGEYQSFRFQLPSKTLSWNVETPTSIKELEKASKMVERQVKAYLKRKCRCFDGVCDEYGHYVHEMKFKVSVEASYE